MATTIRADYENNAEAWWDAAQTDDNAPAALAPMLADGVDEITVSDDEANAILVWASRLPGWNDGPEYAPTALLFEPQS